MHFPRYKAYLDTVTNPKELDLLLKKQANELQIQSPFKIILRKYQGTVKEIVAKCTENGCNARIKLVEADVLDQKELTDCITIYKAIQFNNKHSHTLTLQKPHKDLTEQNSISMLKQRYYALIQLIKSSPIDTWEQNCQTIDINAYEEARKLNVICFSNCYLISTAAMRKNQIFYGETVHFGLCISSTDHSGNLLQVGGFYGQDSHHCFIPFAICLIHLVKPNCKTSESVQNSLSSYDDQFVTALKIVAQRYFTSFRTHSQQNLNTKLVISPNCNYQYAFSSLPRVILVPCRKETAVNLKKEVEEIYNPFIIEEQFTQYCQKVKTVVTTLHHSVFSRTLKELQSSGNLAQNLFLQKIPAVCAYLHPQHQDLFGVCVQDYLCGKFKQISDRNKGGKFTLVKTIIDILEDVLNKGADRCKICSVFEKDFSFQKRLIKEQFPQLTVLQHSICQKTFQLLLHKFILGLNFTTIPYKEAQVSAYFVRCHDEQQTYSVEIIGQRSKPSVRCQCNWQVTLGIPCAHELYVCLKLDIDILPLIALQWRIDEERWQMID